MADREDALDRVRKALVLIDKQIEDSPDPLLLMVPTEQFILFRGLLERIERELREGVLPDPGMRDFEMKPAIFDSWPFTALGAAIIDAEKAYLECVKAGR
jgi:hypothetical protein